MQRSPLWGVKLPLIGCSVRHEPFLDGSTPVRWETEGRFVAASAWEVMRSSAIIARLADIGLIGLGETRT